MAAPPFDVDAINQMITTSFPGTHNHCYEIGDGYAVALTEVTDSDIRPGGFISGPTQFAIADGALWFLSFVALGRIEPMAMTSELSIRFLRPAQGSRLWCRATLETVNRRSVVGTVRVWCDDRTDKITATGQGTYAIPLPR